MMLYKERLDKDKNSEYRLVSFQDFKQTGDIEEAFKYGKLPNFLTGGRRGLHVAIICTNNMQKVTKQIETLFSNCTEEIFVSKEVQTFQDALRIVGEEIYNLIDSRNAVDIFGILYNNTLNENSVSLLKEKMQDTKIPESRIKIIIVLPLDEFKMFKDAGKVFPHFIETVLNAFDYSEIMQKISQLDSDSIENMTQEEKIAFAEQIYECITGETLWKGENLIMLSENNNVNIYYNNKLIKKSIWSKDGILYSITNEPINENQISETKDKIEKILKTLEPIHIVYDNMSKLLENINALEDTRREREDNTKEEKTNPQSSYISNQLNTDMIEKL